MSKTIQEQIREVAIEIIKNHPDGIRYSALHRAIHEADASFNENTIHGTLHTLHSIAEVEKPSKGLYRLVSTDSAADSPSTATPTDVKEDSFYQPFADWLKNDIEDATDIIPLGGNRFKDKWGTPDVIGVRKSRPSDIVESPIEIVVAEIKSNSKELITAFGQACAYCLFSHRSYLVVPRQAPAAELSRLDSLCEVFGLGLVLFDANDPMNPRFEIRMRPKKQEPDLFYTNRYVKQIESELF